MERTTKIHNTRLISDLNREWCIFFTQNISKTFFKTFRGFSILWNHLYAVNAFKTCRTYEKWQILRRLGSICIQKFMIIPNKKLSSRMKIMLLIFRLSHPSKVSWSFLPWRSLREAKTWVGRFFCLYQASWNEPHQSTK